ncbi:MAG: S41 family peptidase [Acholeplasmatales bacterium]|nr:S41 family peptidase [Acholeplasmatales bacterium]
MKKKFLGAALALTGILGLSACGSSVSDYDKDAVVENCKTVDYEFINTSDEYTAKNNNITAYYVNDSDVVYVDAEGYLKSLDGIFDLSGVEFVKDAESLTIKANDETFVITPDGNKITMSDPSVLSITAETESTDYMSNTQYVDSYVLEGKEISYDLSDYEMNIFKSDDLYLVPFSIMNDLYGSINYYNLCFNYDKFYGVFPYVEEENEYYDDILSCHKKSTKEMRTHNYNNLAFLFENLYGLKEDLGFTDFDKLVGEYKDGLLSTNPNTYNSAYADFFSYKLDEGHSYIISGGYEGDHGLASMSFGSRTSKMVSAAYALMYSAPGNGVNYSGDTAFITFSSFDLGTDEELYDSNGNLKDDAYEYDTFYLFKKYLDEARSRGDIKNVMFDVSMNGGGYVATLIKILGFITNDDIYFGTEDSETGSVVVESYKVDTDCDGDYTDDDAYTEFNYYVLTSGYSYSAANMFATFIKEKNYGKVIGQQAGGGKCSVLPIVLTDGTSVAISSTNWSGVGVLDDAENPSIIAYEYGVTPDIKVQYRYFYDWEKLAELLA